MVLSGHMNVMCFKVNVMAIVMRHVRTTLISQRKGHVACCVQLRLAAVDCYDERLWSFTVVNIFY